MGFRRVILLSVALAVCVSADFAQADEATSNVAAVSLSPEITNEIRGAIGNVRTLRDGLAANIGWKRKEQVGFDSTIIALGIASVAAALYKVSNTSIGAIGLGAAGISAYRSYYSPDSEGSAYIEATAAARCVASTAEPLLTAQPEPLWTEISNLNLAIAQVNESSSQLTPGSTDGEDAAAKALTAAQSALAALRAEAVAYNDSPSTIDKAHDLIKNYIDKKIHRTATDFDALKSSLSATTNAASSVSNNQQVSASSQLPAAAQAQARAQISAGTAGGAPPPQVASPPTSLAAAMTPPDKGEVPSLNERQAADPTITQVANARAVAALNAATGHALLELQNSEFSSVGSQISRCVSSLS